MWWMQCPQSRRITNIAICHGNMVIHDHSIGVSFPRRMNNQKVCLQHLWGFNIMSWSISTLPLRKNRNIWSSLDQEDFVYLPVNKPRKLFHTHQFEDFQPVDFVPETKVPTQNQQTQRTSSDRRVPRNHYHLLCRKKSGGRVSYHVVPKFYVHAYVTYITLHVCINVHMYIYI